MESNPILKNWTIVENFDINQKTNKKFISGYVYNHPIYKDGSYITTSSIMFCKKPNLVICKNRTFVLKSVSKNMFKKHPFKMLLKEFGNVVYKEK